MSVEKMQRKFLEVYDAHSDAIFRHCYFRVYSRDLALELMQEAFTKAWQYLLDGNDVENLRAFVYKVANNLIIDHSRKKKDMSLEVLQEDGFEPGEDKKDHIEAKIDGEAVIKVMDQLDQEYRDAVYMRYVDEMKPKEIAEALGESVNVISVRIHRGVKKLQSIMKEQHS